MMQKLLNTKAYLTTIPRQSIPIIYMIEDKIEIYCEEKLRLYPIPTKITFNSKDQFTNKNDKTHGQKSMMKASRYKKQEDWYPQNLNY